MSRGALGLVSCLIVGAGALGAFACGSSNSGSSSAAPTSAPKAEPSNVALAKVFDPKAVEGPSLRIDDNVSVSEMRGCDQAPANSVQGGNAALEKRRQVRDSAYARARAQYIVKDPAAAQDMPRLTSDIRLRYEREMLPQIPALPVLGVDSEPFTVRYIPSFSDRDDEVTVHGRRLSLRLAAGGAAEERVMVYYLNYDRLDPVEPSVILVLAGGVNHDPAKFELDPRGNYASTVAGRLAAEGWPVIVVDDNVPTLVKSLAGLRAVDRALLKKFKRVHVIGLPDALFHFVMFHESPIASAYLSGGSLPLWTRLDSSFPKEPKNDVQVIRDKFQWADFALSAIDQRILLAVATNAGQSGAAKAAFFVEALPILQRHPAAAQYLRIVGNDRDGDGRGDRGQACHDGDTADYRAFFREGFGGDTASRK